MDIQSLAEDIVCLIITDIRTNGNGANMQKCWGDIEPETRKLIRADWANQISACLKEYLDSDK